MTAIGSPARTWHEMFTTFWASQAVSQVVSQSATVTVPLLAITHLGAASEQVGVITFLQYAPVLLITPVLGAYIDSLRRGPIMFSAHVARGVLYALGAVLLALGQMSTEGLTALVLVAGVYTAGFDVSIQTFVPDLVPREELVWANSRIQGSLSFAQVVGPSVGGGLIALGTPWPVLAVFAAGYICAALLFLRSRYTEKLHAMRPGTKMLDRLLKGFRIAWSVPTLKCLLLSSTWFNLFEQAFITTFLVYAARGLNLDAALVGGIVGVGAMGSIAGAAVSSRAPRKRSPVTLLIIYSALASGAPTFLVLMTGNDVMSIVLAVATFFVYGFGVTSYNVHAISLRQAAMPEGAQGRTGAAYRMFAYGALAAGALLSSVMISVSGLLGALLFATSALVIGWFGMSFWYRRILSR
jgi:predicted MFS family arabinose efflux permease